MVKTTLRAADFGQTEELWENSRGKPLFQPIEITWSKPALIDRGGAIQVKDEEALLRNGYLYAIIRNHGKQLTRDKIVYIGITNDLGKRFRNHWKVDEIRGARGPTSISVGKIETPGRRLNSEQAKQLREELEHILIWVLWDDLWNDQKTMSVPGQGRNGSQAWDIANKGYKFCGRMPSRIVFPWAAIVPRRNCARKITNGGQT